LLENCEQLVLRQAIQLHEVMFAQRLTKLRDLELIGCRHLDDIGGLAKLANLKSIVLTGSAVMDLSPLTGLKELERLNLGQSSNLDVTTLPFLPSVRSLSLRSCQVRDVSSLERLANLVDLDLSDNPRLRSVASLVNLPNLRRLVVGGSEGVEDLKLLEGKGISIRKRLMLPLQGIRVV
jgi:internalin A